MKLKLDENLGRRGAQILAAAGHDVASVADQSLQAAEDGALIEVCRQEGRCLVTLDLDFANPLRFRPSTYHGIAVLRLTPRAAHQDLLRLMRELTHGLEHETLTGKLWIVEPGRIRIYQGEHEP